jgi:hypothetical protein
MTEPIASLQECLGDVGMDMDADFLREGMAVLTRLLMDREVSQQIGGEWHERAEGRETHRNGYRDRLWACHSDPEPGQLGVMVQQHATAMFGDLAAWTED